MLPPARPARAAALTVTTASSGSLIVKDGDKTLATFAPQTARAHRGPATVRERSVAGHQIIEVRVPVQGEGPKREELWLAERASGGPKVIWWNTAGALDEDGETSLVVKVDDRGIEEYQTARRLSRCDGTEVALFRRAWDFAHRTFRPAGPELPAPAPTTLKARRGNAPTGKPLGGFFFSAASSSAGATARAAQLRPPAAVNDGDPATVWSTAGSGQGHLLTARSSGGFAITGLRLVPGDTSSESRFRASAKPKRLVLIFDHDPTHNVEVELIEDNDGGGKRYREPFWIALPTPVASACISVLVRDTTSAKVPMAIADLEVMTELDGPEAADRLVASLAQGVSCEARTPLLVRLGEPALAKVSAAILKAPPGPGRACLLAALDALVAAGTTPSPEAATALVAAVDRATPDEEKTILKLLPALPEPPVAGLAALLLDDQRPADTRARAARGLAAVGNEAARAQLFAAVGHGSPELRKTLRTIVGALKAPALPTALAQLEATPATNRGRRADLLAVMGALASREPAAPALGALRAALTGNTSFEEQARSIQSLGLIRDPAAVAALIDVRKGSPDGVLRRLAADELASANGPAVVPALRAALDDNDPQVRETAAAALGRKGDKVAAAQLVAGAKQEPWPQVRRAEIAALGELCTKEGNALLLRAFQKDAEDIRQAALTGIAHCYQGKATGTLLKTLGRLAESADMRSLAARLLGERKDPRMVPGLAEVLKRLLTESQADISLEGVIADTAMILAAIHDPPAVAALTMLVADPRPSVQGIGIDALAMVCDPGLGATALHTATTAKDASVAERAAAAEAHCRDRH
jgi:HEAT repeat protein